MRLPLRTADPLASHAMCERVEAGTGLEGGREGRGRVGILAQCMAARRLRFCRVKYLCDACEGLFLWRAYTTCNNVVTLVWKCDFVIHM